MFRNIFSFNGRIRRTEFGISFIIYLVIYLVILAGADGRSGVKILGLLYVPLVWFLWAQGAKRCHDVGNSGWWQIIPFYVFWLLFQDGNRGENQYGDDPKIKKEFFAETYVDPFPANNNAPETIYDPNSTTDGLEKGKVVE